MERSVLFVTEFTHSWLSYLWLAHLNQRCFMLGLSRLASNHPIMHSSLTALSRKRGCHVTMKQLGSKTCICSWYKRISDIILGLYQPFQEFTGDAMKTRQSKRVAWYEKEWYLLNS